MSWDEEEESAPLAPREEASSFATLEAGARAVMAPAPDDSDMLSRMVQAARSIQRDRGQMIASAKQIGGLLGADGFYRFPMGGTSIEGPSIDMAEALAQEWGGIVYQVRIMHASPLASGGMRIHLRASVFDLRSIVGDEVEEVVATAPPPAKFAKKDDQRERWHTMQTRSAASKVMRNAILRVLPSWYVEPALRAAMEVVSQKVIGKYSSLPEAREAACEALTKRGCTIGELEFYIGQPKDLWAVPQLTTLLDLHTDLRSGRTSIEAWRTDLQMRADAAAVPEQGPRKSALGLPASNGNGIHDAALKAAVNAGAEKQKVEAKVEPQAGPEMAEAEAAQQAAAEQGEQAALPIDDKKTSKRGK